MHYIPPALERIVGNFQKDFTRPTYRRFVLLLGAAITAPGMRTVSNLVRLLGGMAIGHATTYHHVFSARRWRPWALSHTLTRLIVERFVPEGVIALACDDTVFSRPGDHVFGKGRHRDSARSSKVFRAFHFGHKWVVLAILVRLPFASRSWALPVMVALSTTKAWDEAHGKTHRTSPELIECLIARFMRWFPTRKILLVGDRAFATHRLSRFAARSKGRLTLVSRFYAAAALYSPAKPKPKGMGGRVRQKGEHLPSLSRQVATGKSRRVRVSWYGGQKRLIKVTSGVGNWYKARLGALAIKWVFVEDLSGTHRSEYYFTTDTSMSPKQIVEAYTARWNIETTFQEVKSLLHAGSTRPWTKASVLLEVPCLFALYSIVTLTYSTLPTRSAAISWPGKTDLAFSDALHTVRRYLWRNWLFQEADKNGTLKKLKPPLQRFLLNSLAPAA